ncbi:MAG: thioredoxin fold domain-containing protein [Acidobacteria bacterium]|jgi:thiol:disulfide interchange protein DsbD|nr:thioredoxin fold domain-containing protein [Acidobacteriota bacterium]
MKIALALILVFLAPAGSAGAAGPDVVSIRALAPARPPAPGEAATVAIEIAVTPPYHINSDRPLEAYLVPTRVEFEPVPGVVVGPARFPDPEVKHLPVSDSPMAVYSGKVTVTADVSASGGAGRERVLLKGRVRTQACDGRSCHPPVWQPFEVEVALAPGRGAAAVIPVPASADFGTEGIVMTFLLVFLGGLGLALTPCIYPMIPITITYFGGQSGGRKGSVALHALLYVLGMAVTYSVLGVGAALTGGMFGAALQYPPVLLALALVMVFLALGMFDLYELRIPAPLMRLAGGSRGGFAGSLLMGLTVGVVVAPCIGPFVLGLLTYVGNRGSALLGFFLFFTLALGLGVPFLLLGIFSGSLHRLPRSGAWMVWVRKIFGFVLLALAVWFVKQLLPGPFLYPLTLALVLLLGGIYLAWIDTVPGAGKTFAVVRNLVGALFFAAALFAAATGIEAGLERAGTGRGERAAGISWRPCSEEALEQARREGKPVLIDFFADWCVPCREMDEKTFSLPEVIALSRRFVMLKVDLTEAGDPLAENLRSRYGVQGVPTYVFLDPRGEEIAALRGAGFETGPPFLDRMKRALPSAPAPAGAQTGTAE